MTDKERFRPFHEALIDRVGVLADVVTAESKMLIDAGEKIAWDKFSEKEIRLNELGRFITEKNVFIPDLEKTIKGLKEKALAPFEKLGERAEEYGAITNVKGCITDIIEALENRLKKKE